MNHDEAIAFLLTDGNFRVPCCRYGFDSSSCAEVAFDAAVAIQNANGDEINEDLLDSIMGLVVNDSDGIAELIFNHHDGDDDEGWYKDEKKAWEAENELEPESEPEPVDPNQGVLSL